MAHRPPPRRSAEEWQDLYYGLDERYRQVQHRLSEREEELKHLKVAQRRAATTRYTREKSTQPLPTRRGPTDSQPPHANSPTEERNVGVAVIPSAARQHDAQSVAAASAHIHHSVNPNQSEGHFPTDAVSSAWAAAAPPDPSMVWGMENSVQNYVTANALYHANEELRQRLEDAASLVKSLQHELAASRGVVTGTQARLEDASQQIRQLVRERDVATQKLSVTQRGIADLERALQVQSSEEERSRFALESQITELRSRLVVGADSNELLSRDVRTLLTEVKEKSSEAQSVRSRLALAESALTSQRHNNESLLVELRSLNGQLVNERKRLLAMTREAQLAALRSETARDMEVKLADAQESRVALEREHVRLMESLVQVTEGALRQAREEVRHELDDAQATATRWEEAAQLLYRDATQRTQAHVQCREECEVAKRDRDEAAMGLRAALEELRMSRAKLDIVWPTHETDTRDLTSEELRGVFGSCRAVFRPRPTSKTRLRKTKSGTGEQARGGENAATTNTGGIRGLGNDRNDGEEEEEEEEDTQLDGDITVELRHVAGSMEEEVRELREANAALVAELAQQRVVNELQTARLQSTEGSVLAEREAVAAAAAALERRESAAQDLLQTQVDRVAFLEAQVRSFRGYDVSPTHSLRDVADGETVFELFIGQILATETPPGVELRNAFPPVFCSADFLLHETVTTPIVTGLNAFFDTTVSFCVAMDALLLCYLQSRELLVQLHRVRPHEEIQERSQNGAETIEGGIFTERLFETIAEGSASLWSIVQDETQLRSQRPTLRGHISLRTPNGHHIASVEFCVTVRVPFSATFQTLASEAARDWIPPPPPQQLQQPQQQRSERPFQSDSLISTSSPNRIAPQAALGLPHSANRGMGPTMSQSGSMQLVSTHRPTPGRGQDATEWMSTTSSSVSLLETPAGRSPSGFAHIPRATAASLLRNQHYSSGNTHSNTLPICALVVDVCRLHLPSHLSPVPRLSCYYALSPLGRDAYLPAPPTPRYECEYLQEGGSGGTRFPIGSTRELLAVTREPLTLFFFDESVNAGGNGRSASRGGSGSGTGQRGGQSYWAFALGEWRVALQQPEVYATLEMPLMRQEGGRLDGATVRVRLLATARAAANSHSPNPTVEQRETFTTSYAAGSGSRDRGQMEESMDVEMLRRQLDG